MPPEVSMREAVEAAYDAHSEPETDEATQAPAEPESAPVAPPETPQAPLEEPPAPQPGEKAASGERVRDALGRFAEKPAGGAPKQEAPQQQQPAQNQQQPEAVRAPVNVPPQLREHWGALPQGFRDYTVQREAQVQQLLQNVSRERGVAQAFMSAVQPHMQTVNIEAGGDPIKAVTGLMEVASRLRFGTPGEKAQLIAHFVNDYGVDIQMLDNALVGVASPQGNGHAAVAPDVRGLIRAELAPLLQHAQSRRAQEQERIDGEVRTELQTFAADPKNEFFEDVRTLMADAIEIAERAGYTMPLKDAYDRACLLHPEVSKVILARQAGQSAQRLTSAAQRAKAAAVSVKGAAPVGNPSAPEPSSVREAIEAAIESHSRV